MYWSGVRGGGLGLKLAQNKVSAGHSSKMRGAKDLTKNSAADMAAIFGVRVDAYSLAPIPHPPSCVDPNSSTILPDVGYNGGAVAKRKKRRRDKKNDDKDGLSGGAAKKKEKKRKCVS